MDCGAGWAGAGAGAAACGFADGVGFLAFGLAAGLFLSTLCFTSRCRAFFLLAGFGGVAAVSWTRTGFGLRAVVLSPVDVGVIVSVSGS